ncbi:MAG: hypothetical protein RI967_2478 [Planctomycetota bacterium]|jgi:hypothetical protein
MQEDRSEMSATPPAPPAADPFAAYPDDLAARRSRWPIVFGAISLVIAVCGFCVQGFGALGAVFNQQMMAMAGLEVSPPPRIVQVVGGAQAAVLAILGIVLVIGSVQLMRRRPAGARLVLAWAVARLVMVVVGLGLAVLTLKPQVEWQVTMTGEIRDSLRAKGMKEEQLPPLQDAAAIERQSIVMLAIASGAFAIWPFTMALVLTGRRSRAEIAQWSLPPA